MFRYKLSGAPAISVWCLHHLRHEGTILKKLQE